MNDSPKEWRACRLSDDELQEVGSSSDEELLRKFWEYQDRLEPDNPDDPSSDLIYLGTLDPKLCDVVAGIRVICYRVLEARRTGNLFVEKNALGAHHRWSRRGQGVDAMTYVARNVGPIYGLSALDQITRGFLPRAASGRAGEGKLFSKPINLRRMLPGR